MTVYVNAAGCTNACIQCPMPDRARPEVVFTRAELLDLAAEWGPVSPQHDPGTHPDFPAIFDPRIAGVQEELSINPSGLAVHPEPADLFEQLASYGYRAVRLALHGAGRSHDAFVGRKGAYADILVASQRAAAAGFAVNWDIILDTRFLADVPALVDLKRREFPGRLWVGVRPHIVAQRFLRSYERMRPTAADVERAFPGLQEQFPLSWPRPIPEYSEASWTSLWQAGERGAFRHAAEPRGWPPEEPLERLTIYILRDRRVYLDPHYAPLVCLGELAEGRARLLGRLAELPRPLPWAALDAGDLDLPAADRLHPEGYSVRYKAISQRLFTRPGDTLR
jgi:hypothetical protein